MSNRRAKKHTDDDAAVREKIAAFPESYRSIGERMHEVILAAAPNLKPRVWYGMPGYAKSRSAPVLCFFRVDDYMSFGLTEKAHFEWEEEASGGLMPSAWFLTGLDEATEQQVTEIVRKAVR